MRSKKLTIFEGPDGSGKSTAAKEFAERTGAKYVHFPALPHMDSGLARLYVEAMLPALMGYDDVVFDRCWLSETPYGKAFRKGADRLLPGSRRMLERLALRCGAVVIRCDPGLETCLANYKQRKKLEYLESEDQLRAVYHLYEDQPCHLIQLEYDYHKESVDSLVLRSEDHRPRRHPLNLASAGNLMADTVIVGDSFGERKNHDPWYQWPFASFTNKGCSQWLAARLDEAEVCEYDLLWVNADQDLSVLHQLNPYHIIALGDKADGALEAYKLRHVFVPHPAAWKRFNFSQPYEPFFNALSKYKETA